MKSFGKDFGFLLRQRARANTTLMGVHPELRK